MKHLPCSQIIRLPTARNSSKEIAEFAESMDIKPKIAGTMRRTKELIPTIIPTKTPTKTPTTTSIETQTIRMQKSDVGTVTIRDTKREIAQREREICRETIIIIEN